MSFATRPEVCGRGTSIHHGPHSTTNWGSYSSRDVEWDYGCEYGPARVVLEVRDREVTSLRFYIGGRWRPAGDGVTDLGTVGAKAAADYLLALAGEASGRAAKDAILPATVADSSVVWPGLVRIARNDERPRAVRNQAVFWLGQMAGEVVTANLDSIVRDDDVNREVRKQAVFALSQRPRDEGIPALIRIAKGRGDPEVRKQALFWLSQSNDPRAISVFEEILSKP